MDEMDEMEEVICDTCRWMAEEWDGYYCCCLDSPLAGEDVSKTDGCRAWEGKHDG